jgi:molybdate transport system substrate-binding protein
MIHSARRLFGATYKVVEVTMKRLFGIALAIAISPGAYNLGVAQAADVKLLSALVMKPALIALSGDFERISGHKLRAIEALIKDGKVTPGSNVILARSGVGAAVREGAPKPDISSVDALKRALLTAKSIAYPVPDAGHASGIHFRGVIEQLGIAKEVNAKAKFMEGTVAEFAAQDTAEIIISQPMEILATPGYALVGWLPSELQDYEKFTWAAGVTANTKEPAAANALVQFLASPAAATVIRAKGMQPGSK